MDVKASKRESNPKLETHHVYLRNGQVVSVLAYTYHVHLSEQVIYFYNSESKSKTGRNKKTFWQLSEVAGVVAESALAELPPLIQLQGEVKALTARLDTYESAFASRLDMLQRNINDAIASAVATLSSQGQS